MGLRYVSFRMWFEIQKRIGTLKLKFPINPKQKEFINLEQWKNLNTVFLFQSKETLSFPKDKNAHLEFEAKQII